MTPQKLKPWKISVEKTLAEKQAAMPASRLLVGAGHGFRTELHPLLRPLAGMFTPSEVYGYHGIWDLGDRAWYTLYYTIRYYTTLYYTILYYSILFDTIRYYSILFDTIRYYSILFDTIRYYSILYYTILYYTILY